MIDHQHLDIRTITLGISLYDCADSDIKTCAKKIYDKICTKAEHLVETGNEIEREYGIPIINKRISVTPIAYAAASCTSDDYAVIGHALDDAAKTCGVNFIGGFSSLVQKGFTNSDLRLINSIPETLSSTELVCSSVNVATTRAGINMDAVAMMGRIIKRTAELTANLYGILGDNEEYSEYHHIGYDITSSRILENVLRFADSYSGNQKVFFITGARSAGGGVANLLAKKLIDKFGPSSVYAYTFNAVSTINGNMIPEGSKIPNLKYTPIMNVYNDDELMVMFTSEETNMYKYGTNVHMSLSENLTSKVASAFKKVHKSSYDKDMKNKVVDILNRTFNINLSGYVPSIFGFIGTELTDEEMEDYMKISNDYSTGKLHYVFGENDIEKITATWDKVYSMCIENNMSSLVITHAETMFNQYSNELQRIHNMSKDIGKGGISKNVDYVAQTKSINESQNTRVYGPIYIPPENNDNSGTIGNLKMTSAIEKMGKFYLTHVATYLSKYKTTDGTVTNYASTKKAYEHLTTNGTIGSSAGDKKWHVALNGTEAIKLISGIGRFAYKSDDLDSVAIDSEKGPEIYADYAGDDCSGFASAVLRIANNGNRGNGGTLSTTGYGAVKDIDALSLMNKDSPNSKALFNLGYEMYKKVDENWKKYYLKDGSVVDETESSISINFIQPGDMLVCRGTPDHVEFYVGDDYAIVFKELLGNKITRNENKKTYDWENSFPTRSGKNTKTGNQAYGTSSWGNVIDEFPTETKDGNRHYFYYDSGANCFRHCECGNGPDKDDTVHWNNGRTGCNFHRREYTVIWRKK